VEPLEAVEQQVECELELELVVAATADRRPLVVGPGRGHLDDVGVPRGEPAERRRSRARVLASPVPVLVHVVGATVYCLLGALQFAPGFRRRRPGWHRAAGRLLVVCGLAAALSGVWMPCPSPVHPSTTCC
jgi:predicted membrane protein DUF2306